MFATVIAVICSFEMFLLILFSVYAVVANSANAAKLKLINYGFS